jgi:hypothetical protein
MSVAIALRRHAEKERDQDEADGLFLFRGKDEDFAAGGLWTVPVGLHSSSASLLPIMLQKQKIRSKIRIRRKRCMGVASF